MSKRPYSLLKEQTQQVSHSLDPLLEEEACFPSQQGFLVSFHLFSLHWEVEFGAECQEKNLKPSPWQDPPRVILNAVSWRGQSHIQGKPAASCLLLSTVPMLKPTVRSAGLEPLVFFGLGLKATFKDASVEMEGHRLKGKLLFSASEWILFLAFNTISLKKYKISLNCWLYLNYQIPSPKIFLSKCHFY